MKTPDWVFVSFIRPENMERLGDLSQFGKGFKTVKGERLSGPVQIASPRCSLPLTAGLSHMKSPRCLERNTASYQA